MKKILITSILLFCIFNIMQSQVEISKNIHNSYHEKSISKIQVEYIEPGASGKDVLWDFSKLQVLNKKYMVEYYYPNVNDSITICGIDNGTRYYYNKKNDSIWMTGFENHTTIIDYFQPELLMKFPFGYGDIISSSWDGEGVYGNLFSVKTNGETIIKIDAEGRLFLPNKNEVDSVLRVRTIKKYEETGKDKLKMTLEDYKWYSPHQIHPVFESIKTILHKNGVDSIIFSTSFYYLPEKSVKSLLEEPVMKTEKISDVTLNVDELLSDVKTVPNPVKNDLTIEYNLARQAQVQFALYGINGASIYRSKKKTQDGGYYSEVIPMGHLDIGTYVIHIVVDNLVLSKMIIKQ